MGVYCGFTDVLLAVERSCILEACEPLPIVLVRWVDISKCLTNKEKAFFITGDSVKVSFCCVVLMTNT